MLEPGGRASASREWRSPSRTDDRATASGVPRYPAKVRSKCDTRPRRRGPTASAARARRRRRAGSAGRKPATGAEERAMGSGILAHAGVPAHCAAPTRYSTEAGEDGGPTGPGEEDDRR